MAVLPGAHRGLAGSGGIQSHQLHVFAGQGLQLLQLSLDVGLGQGHLPGLHVARKECRNLKPILEATKDTYRGLRERIELILGEVLPPGHVLPCEVVTYNQQGPE